MQVNTLNTLVVCCGAEQSLTTGTVAVQQTHWLWSQTTCGLGSGQLLGPDSATR